MANFVSIEFIGSLASIIKKKITLITRLKSPCLRKLFCDAFFFQSCDMFTVFGTTWLNRSLGMVPGVSMFVDICR